MERKPRFRALIAGLLLVAGAAQAQPREEALSLNLMAYQSRSHVLTASAASVSGTLTIDDASEANVLFISDSKSLEIVLTSPNGERIVFGAPDAPNVYSRISPDPSDPGSLGANYLFVLSDPQPGAWTYEVREPSPITTERAVLVNLISASEVRTGLLGGGQDYRTDRDVRLALVTVEGESVLKNVSVSARLVKLGDPAFAGPAVTFRDDGTNGDETAGDGLFTASFQPGSPGRYNVLATVTGTNAQGNAFERSASANFTLQALSARLLGTFDDTGVDVDGDSLLDRIDLSPDLEILAAGQYNVAVTLKASNGATFTANRIQSFAVGTGNVAVAFPTEDLEQALSVDGPYQVAEVRVEKVDAEPLVTADVAFNLGDTAAYRLNQFQRDAIELVNGGTSEGIDTNGNGKFDFLRVRPRVDFLRSGFYSWSARLVDSDSTEIALASGQAFLAAGGADLTLTFNGSAIGANGADGPYFVKNLIVFGGGESLIVDDVHTTGPFAASQFEGYVADREPPQITAQATPAFLWPPDHRMVEILVNVTVTDNVDPNPEVRLESITSNQGENAIGDGNTSDDIVIDNGRIFLRAERSGVSGDRVYTLTYSARDDAGNVGFGTATVTVAHDQRN